MKEREKSPAASGKRPLGLYLHIPFCRQKCLYCDFLSAPGTQEVIGRYVTALCGQLGHAAGACRDRRVETVFLGGGTPSLLTPAQADRIFDALYRHFDVAPGAEITMESNPGTLTAQKLRAYRAAGVNRLSIGLQSASDAQLRQLGRIHTWADFLENYGAARRAGFDNLNIDLMSALPGQSEADWLDTLKRTAELEPEHISAYSLIIEEGTPFYARYAGGGPAGEKAYPPLPTEEEERRMYERTAAFLGERGYRRYEISNYARSGRECRHNVGYWRRAEYLGLGLGAASLMEEVRFRCEPELQAYLDCAQKGRWEALYGERQPLSEQERMEEFLFLGLRLTEGISLPEFRRQFGRGLFEVYGGLPQRLEEQGLLQFYEGKKKMKLTGRGVDVSNYVLAQFLLT